MTPSRLRTNAIISAAALGALAVFLLLVRLLPAAPKPATVSGAPARYGASVVYAAPDTAIHPALAADFDIADVANLADMERAYGFTFTPAERELLARNKFIVKDLLDTTIRPFSGGDNIREVPQLYAQLTGARDPKLRGPENALFFSADAFFSAYSDLFTELLKEMENEVFFPAMRSLTATFFESAQTHLAAATTDADRQTWTKVRDYFAVPYALFETTAMPLAAADYYEGGIMLDPTTVMADYAERDATVDVFATAEAVVDALPGIAPASREAILEDLRTVYAAEGRGIPDIFKEEYRAHAAREGVMFAVDFSQFTPRAHYTSSSLRRQYFRAMKWYIDVPFFVTSPELTTYAFGVSQLFAEHPEALADYDRLEAAIAFMVGESDDLMPRDYLAALDAARGAADPSAAVMEHLLAARNPRIKSLAAAYPTVGTADSDEVLLKTKGMRFFSGKFIIDSYWTGFLTQGDELPRPGYTQKLPPMASALEVMALLGSDYARERIPELDFYGPGTSEAINQAMAELTATTATLTDDEWTSNLYNGWLWTIKGLFSWQQSNAEALPQFMQSPAWAAKTLMTANAFWAELRHATLLYAKQSFAELGGGGSEACDARPMPEPPKGYIEPQLEAYARLSYLARRTEAGLTEQGYELKNLYPLRQFTELLETVQEYVRRQLGNEELSERVVSLQVPDPERDGETCERIALEGASDWEALRLAIVDGLQKSIPIPTEGPVLPAKDRRAALVADVHTGGDSANPHRILYQGVGVPRVIFVAVADANGPRLTVGFASSHYEFTELYGGQRLTDEDWQTHFYVGEEPYNAYQYTPTATWPQPNAWYAPLFGR